MSAGRVSTTAEWLDAWAVLVLERPVDVFTPEGEANGRRYARAHRAYMIEIGMLAGYGERDRIDRSVPMYDPNAAD